MAGQQRTLRGQVWSIDFTIGLITITIVLMFVILMWNNIIMQGVLASQSTKMGASAFFASESLLATPGEPESWEMLQYLGDNVSAIGLVNGRNELNRMKLERLVAENATSYNDIKARLGLQQYEFGMQVTDLGRNIIHYEFGKFSNHSLNNSLEFDRLGILDGDPVLVHMEVWGG